MRDTLRAQLAAHFDSSLNTFTNSFVVGANAHVCERAFAVACAVSEPTFTRSRADVTINRGWHKDRARKRANMESEDRRMLDGWVTLQRESMEGDKVSRNKWYGEKMSRQQLWNRYVASCDAANQPCVGTPRLLHKIWREHKEYKEVPPTGHSICDTCGMLASERASLAGLVDSASVQARKALAEREAAHHAFHKQEYKYYDLAVTRATHVPQDLTTITIDAPTRHQFDVPSQARSKRDTVKKLDDAHRWQSKLEGVLDAGSKHAPACIRHVRPHAARHAPQASCRTPNTTTSHCRARPSSLPRRQSAYRSNVLTSLFCVDSTRSQAWGCSSSLLVQHLVEVLTLFAPSSS